MKGLVLKDMLNLRLQIIGGVFITLFFHLPIMMFGSNAESPVSPVSPDIMISIVYGMMNYVAVTIFSHVVLSTIRDDEITGWHNIEITMPVGRSTPVCAKLLCTAVVTAIFTVWCLIINMTALIFGYAANYELLVAIPLCSGVLAMLVLSPVTVMACKSGGRGATALYLAITVAAAAVVTVITFAALSSDISADALRAIFYIALPAAAAVSVTLSLLYAAKKEI